MFFCICAAKVRHLFEIIAIFAEIFFQKNTMTDIFCIGNALLDALQRVEGDERLQALHLQKGAMQLIDSEKYAKISHIMNVENCEISTGGSGGNVALCSARLGQKAFFCGKTGEDDKSALFRSVMCRNGVMVAPLSCSLPMGVASTFITPDGQRTFATYLGAGATLHAEELEESWFSGVRYVFVEGYLVQDHSLIERAVDLAHAAGAEVCLDLASYNIVAAEHEFFAHLLKKTDILMANEEESHAMTGLQSEESLEALAQVCPTVVVKVGAKGALGARGAERAKVPAVTVSRVVDTTAAGDFFAAGFLTALGRGTSLSDALLMGAKCSAEVIQVMGTCLCEEAWKRLRAAVPEN